jgi:hypothetical protein
MTRRGTLAYYLAAWVIGCFVISALMLAKDLVNGAGNVNGAVLITTYFFALIFGAADALLFAMLLRRVMRLWGTSVVWHWLLAGAAVGLVLMLLVQVDDAWTRWRAPLTGPAGYLFQVFLMAPDALRRSAWWQAPLGGGITAAVLALVDRAFARTEPLPEPKASAA